MIKSFLLKTISYNTYFITIFHINQYEVYLKMLTKKKKIINNALILMFSSLIIKALGLLNRIILTRYLGNIGISLYSLIMPTIMLFMSLSCFSLNTAMIKVSSKYKSKKVIIIGILIAIITTSVSCLSLLTFLNTITHTLLKQDNAYYPILFSIPLLYFTSISSVIRGYFSGIEKMSITSCANIIEQISRIIFTLFLFIILKNKSIVFYVIISICTMTFGEICSLIFTLLKLKKIKNNNLVIPKQIEKELINIALPSTLSSLISNITFFLEPVIFTFVLTKLNNSSNEIMIKYSETTAYSLPLITMFSFIPGSISIAIMPKISIANNNTIKEFITKIITITLIPALIISLILINYSSEICNTLYNTSIGSSQVKKYTPLFIFFYFISPFSTILLSTNKSKQLFIISTIVHIIKLAILFVLPFIYEDSLIISYLISYILMFIILFIFLIKQYHFKIPFKNIIILLIIYICTLLFNSIIKVFNLNYIINIILISLFYTLFSFIFLFHNRNNI